MATTIKEGSNAKEKSRPSSSSAHHNIDSTMARRTTPKPFTADSSDKKPTPNYLKHTMSSGKDVCMYGKSQASDDTNLKYSSSSRRKSTDPSPTQTSTKLKRTMSANPRIKTSTRPSSVSSTPSTRAVGGSTNKPLLDKTSKAPLRGGKAQPVLTRPMSIKKGSSSTPASKKETKSRTSPTNKAPSKSDEQEIESKHDEETNTELEQGIDGELSEKDGIQEENPPTIDQVGPESKEIEDEKSNNGNESSTTLPEEDVVESNPSREEQNEENKGQENEEQEDADEKQSNVIEDSSNADDKGIPLVGESNEQSKPQDENEMVAKKEELGEETNDNLGIESDDASKLNFRKGKELEKEEEGNGNQRLKFKERAVDMEGNAGDAKPEQENVVLKRQDVQGKKEAPAYNDVIEETASKLVEKRKSKVKALVGAFETVISLEND